MQIFQPMPLQRRSLPFDDPDWIYELKMDGFRALAVIEHGRAQLISRNGHLFASFSALAESISDSLPNVRAIIEGEIYSLEENPGALGDFKRSRPHAERESQVTPRGLMPSGKRPAGILVAFVDVEEVIAERFHGIRGLCWQCQYSPSCTCFGRCT